jgi:outer membrane protein assembly factor BamA
MRTKTVTLLLLVCAILSPFAHAAATTTGQQLTVEELACRGNDTVSCTFILGQVYLAPGDRVDEEEIQNAKLRLSVLRNFSSVSIYLEKGSERGKARVIVEVVERSPINMESTFGLLAFRPDVYQLTSLRLTHTNLFGTGKLFDARASEYWRISGDRHEAHETSARIAYVDPHLFDSKRTFMALGAGWLDYETGRNDNGDEFRRRQLSVDATVGRRLWDFSYFSMGYQYRPVREVFSRVRDDNGQFITHNRLRSGVLIYSFGWNTEDDPYFPTRGSVLSSVVIAAGGESENWNTVVRKTWSWGRTSMTAQLATRTRRSFTLGRPISPTDMFGGIQRGRWYASINSEVAAHTEDGHDIRRYWLESGVLLETQRFGIVRLFVFKNTESR